MDKPNEVDVKSIQKNFKNHKRGTLLVVHLRLELPATDDDADHVDDNQPRPCAIRLPAPRLSRKVADYIPLNNTTNMNTPPQRSTLSVARFFVLFFALSTYRHPATREPSSRRTLAIAESSTVAFRVVWDSFFIPSHASSRPRPPFRPPHPCPRTPPSPSPSNLALPYLPFVPSSTSLSSSSSPPPPLRTPSFNFETSRASVVTSAIFALPTCLSPTPSSSSVAFSPRTSSFFVSSPPHSSTTPPLASAHESSSLMSQALRWWWRRALSLSCPLTVGSSSETPVAGDKTLEYSKGCATPTVGDRTAEAATRLFLWRHAESVPSPWTRPSFFISPSTLIRLFFLPSFFLYHSITSSTSASSMPSRSFSPSFTSLLTCHRCCTLRHLQPNPTRTRTCIASATLALRRSSLPHTLPPSLRHTSLLSPLPRAFPVRKPRPTPYIPFVLHHPTPVLRGPFPSYFYPWRHFPSFSSLPIHLLPIRSPLFSVLFFATRFLPFRRIAHVTGLLSFCTLAARKYSAERVVPRGTHRKMPRHALNV
ncbi:hypothetical protein C8J57DRAFT_1576625 [Mycena rebaudengoi]|nr:hypothetical protein C8J57DRAFT_1576625 [Mycena rebaudengoi]